MGFTSQAQWVLMKTFLYIYAVHVPGYGAFSAVPSRKLGPPRGCSCAVVAVFAAAATFGPTAPTRSSVKHGQTCPLRARQRRTVCISQLLSTLGLTNDTTNEVVLQGFVQLRDLCHEAGTDRYVYLSVRCGDIKGLFLPFPTLHSPRSIYMTPAHRSRQMPLTTRRW
jgi:hypothetical protein